MRIWQEGKLRRINLLEGSVRSGKTWISLVLWAFWVSQQSKGREFLMVGKTLTSLRRNCLELLVRLVGTRNFSYSTSEKEARLFGRLVYLEGANDARAESKIRGMTLGGAYCDELTLFAEDFFTMLLSRLSERGAKLIGTTNPDGPSHWLKVEYIDRKSELDMLLLPFLIDDNPYLDPEYVRQLKREYTGVFYDRFILGLWKVAEGLVYPMFDPARHVVKDFGERGLWYVSIDYGTMNPCSMGLWVVGDDAAVRVAEFYHDGRQSRRLLTDEEYYGELERLAGNRLIQRVIVDPSAASFIECIRRHGRFRVRGAENPVIPGIRVTGTLIGAGKILVHEGCKDFLREIQSYRWDDKAGEDKVVKEFDHAMDDMRYFCNTVLNTRNKISIGNVRI